eukprot:scaffold253284_cov35-Tisochrysis_lutea.AAC.2
MLATSLPAPSHEAIVYCEDAIKVRPEVLIWPLELTFRPALVLPQPLRVECLLLSFAHYAVAVLHAAL